MSEQENFEQVAKNNPNDAIVELEKRVAALEVAAEPAAPAAEEQPAA